VELGGRGGGRSHSNVYVVDVACTCVRFQRAIIAVPRVPPLSHPPPPPTHSRPPSLSAAGGDVAPPAGKAGAGAGDGAGVSSGGGTDACDDPATLHCVRAPVSLAFSWRGCVVVVCRGSSLVRMHGRHGQFLRVLGPLPTAVAEAGGGVVHSGKDKVTKFFVGGVREHCTRDVMLLTSCGVGGRWSTMCGSSLQSLHGCSCVHMRPCFARCCVLFLGVCCCAAARASGSRLAPRPSPCGQCRSCPPPATAYCSCWTCTLPLAELSCIGKPPSSPGRGPSFPAGHGEAVWGLVLPCDCSDPF
jgi:hypothetical protein